MKNFKSFLNEQHPANNFSKHASDFDLIDIADDTVVRRLNSFLGTVTNMDSLIPEQCVEVLRRRLQNLGIQFPMAGAESFNEDSGEIVLPLTQYGGRFGKDIDTPYNEFINDDGISHKVEGGRKITFKYNKEENGKFKVFAAMS